MICLDTNYLIRGLVPGSVEATKVITWANGGESLITPMIAWYEFICGPVGGDQIRAIRGLLTEIVPFGEAQAEQAARLFNVANRKRSLRVDAMIAGTTVVLNAALATNNRSDFEVFAPHGLRLV